jgi:hypothetical protein
MVVLKEAVTLSRIFSVVGFFTDFLCTVCHSRNGEAALGSRNTRTQEYKNTRWSLSKKAALEQYPKFTFLKSIDPSPPLSGVT